MRKKDIDRTVQVRILYFFGWWVGFVWPTVWRSRRWALYWDFLTCGEAAVKSVLGASSGVGRVGIFFIDSMGYKELYT